MADTKISNLTAATTPLAGTEVLPIVQSGSTVKVSVANLTAGRSVGASALTVTGEAVLATTSGSVGVGTASPSPLAANYTTLDIRGSLGGALKFGNATNSAYIYSDSNETNFSTATSKPLLFGTNAAERMRIDTSGVVTMNAYGAGAHDEIPDRQGRVTIPQGLRTYAGLEKECVVIGANTRVEIWDSAAWNEYLADREKSFADVSEEVFPGLF